MPAHPAFKDAGKSSGLEIWRIENFEPVPVRKTDYGKFFTGDSYIILKTKAGRNNDYFSWDIHFWLGSESSQDETGSAAILSVELDDSLGGGPTQHREIEGYESALFLSYFTMGGIRYVKGGVDSGFHHAVTNDSGEKRLYQVKGKKNVRVRQVDVNVKSMNKGDCFILDGGKEIYVWVGPQAAGSEKIKAISAANNIRDQDHGGRPHVTIIDSSCTDDETNLFFTELGSGSPDEVPDASEGGDDQEFEKSQEVTVTLYKVSDEDGNLNCEVVGLKPLSNTLLDTNDCFILDTVTSGIYVWIGKHSTPQEKVQSFKKGADFIASKSYPPWIKIQRVVEGAEPTAFKEYFTNWKNTQAIKSAYMQK